MPTTTRFAAHTALGAIAVSLAFPAAAQIAVPVTQDTPPAAETSPTGAAADIVVTGSRIRGIAPVGSNVIAIDAEKIAQEPVISTNDLLRRVPQVVSLGANRAGGNAQNGAANATRGAGINLRGLSTNATLLLYDGRRFPPQGTQGQFTDPSVIPSIALGRVEVVADGASAIYGSDAVAGVVNFIFRKNFDGIEGRARYGFTAGNYQEGQLAAIGGKRWNGGWAMVAGEWSKNTELFGRDLDFYQDNNVYRGGRDLRVTTCNPGTVTVGTATYPIPEGGVTPATASRLVAGPANRCFYNGADAVIPNQIRTSIVAAASQEVTDRIRVFADGFWSRRHGDILRFESTSIVVPSSNPFYVAPPGTTPPLCATSVGAPAGARCVTVGYSFFPEMGTLSNPYHASSWNVAGGIEVKPFGDFRVTGYYAHGEADEVADRRLSLSSANLAAAARDANPATALNVFGGPNNPATLAKIMDNLFVITGRTRLDVLNAQADGSLFELPGGQVRIAVGGEHRVEYTFTDLVTGTAAVNSSVHDAGSRNVDALFGELFIPFFGPGNARPGLEQLSLSAALRHERYSDFGSTTNPKFGLTYRPFRGITLKGTYGTSFRAPTFTEVSTIAGGAGLYFDQNQPGLNGPITGIGIAGGNPNLKPETARTWSASVELAPPQIRGLVASLSYFRINYADQIIALRNTPGLLTNPIYASFVQFNPSAAQVAALVNSGLPINSAITQSAVMFIADGRRQNLGTSLLRGLDYTLNYEWRWGELKLDAGLQGTYFTKFKAETVRGAGFVDVVNTIGFPQRFRVQADAGFDYRKLRGRVTLNHLGGYLNNTVPAPLPAQHVRDYDTVDVSLGYELTPHIILSADVRNLLNERPPFVDQARGYDPQSANPVPSLISFTAQVKL